MPEQPDKQPITQLILDWRVVALVLTVLTGSGATGFVANGLLGGEPPVLVKQVNELKAALELERRVDTVEKHVVEINSTRFTGEKGAHLETRVTILEQSVKNQQDTNDRLLKGIERLETKIDSLRGWAE